VIEHVLHLPRSQRRNIEIGYLGDRNKCPFCGAYGFVPGKICRCGVACPSEKSYQKPKVKKKKPAPPRVDRLEYEPQHDPDNWPEIDQEDMTVPWD
jgi:hypothetical protein